MRPIHGVAAVRTEPGRSTIYRVFKDRVTLANGLVASLAFPFTCLTNRPAEFLRNTFRTESDRRRDAPTTRYRALGKSERFKASGVGKNVVRLFLTEGRFLPSPWVYRHVPFVFSPDLFHAIFLAATTVR